MTKGITRGTRELLIVASIAVLAVITFLVLNDQAQGTPVIEQEQKIEPRVLPNQAPIELRSRVSMVSGAELREYVSLGVSNERTWAGKMRVALGGKMLSYCTGYQSKSAAFCRKTAVNLICPQCAEVLKWLDAKAKWYNDLGFRQ